MNEIATLEQARAADLALAGSANSVFLRVITDEDRCWDKVCVECPVGEVNCSEDVLGELVKELRSEFGDDIPEALLHPTTRDDIVQLLKEAGLYDRLQEGH